MLKRVALRPTEEIDDPGDDLGAVAIDARCIGPLYGGNAANIQDLPAILALLPDVSTMPFTNVLSLNQR